MLLEHRGCQGIDNKIQINYSLEVFLRLCDCALDCFSPFGFHRLRFSRFSKRIKAIFIHTSYKHVPEYRQSYKSNSIQSLSGNLTSHFDLWQLSQLFNCVNCLLFLPFASLCRSFVDEKIDPREPNTQWWITLSPPICATRIPFFVLRNSFSPEIAKAPRRNFCYCHK